MILHEIKNIKSDSKELRKFGITIGVVLIAIAFLFTKVASTGFSCLVVTAAALILFGFIFPQTLFYLHKFWMIFSILLSFISTKVIITLLFYFIVTPIGIIMRLSGKDFLDTKIDKNKSSYWIKRETKVYLSEDTEKQF
jgi:hypothetical protein